MALDKLKLNRKAKRSSVICCTSIEDELKVNKNNTLTNLCALQKQLLDKYARLEPVPLPADRVKNANVFEITGINLAGPLFLKDGAKDFSLRNPLHEVIGNDVPVDAEVPVASSAAVSGNPEISVVTTSCSADVSCYPKKLVSASFPGVSGNSTEPSRAPVIDLRKVTRYGRTVKVPDRLNILSCTTVSEYN